MSYKKQNFESGQKLYASQLNYIEDGIVELSEEINNISDPPDVSAFITRAVNDLENYYRKDETYTREEIDGRISAIPKFSIAVVYVLPTDVISETTIYLVPGGVDGNLYTEYIYVNGTWEILGSQRVDLTGYATQTWTLQQLAGYQPKGNYLTEHQDISGKLDANKLPEAVNTALAQAKASGEFDGKDGISPTVAVSTITGGHRITITDKNGTKTVDVMDGEKGDSGRGIAAIARTSGNGAAGTTDTYTITYTDGTTSTFSVYNGKNGTNGTSVTVSNVTESTADGGSNVVTFSDGKTVTIKNGSKGSAGTAGAAGADGISPTVSVSKSGKVTTIAIIDKNGTKTATINDGADGSAGATGATGPAGKTPVKGTDYWTDADQEAIVQQVIVALGTPVFGTIGDNKVITLKGDFAEGEYTFRAEDKDGRVVEIGKALFADTPAYTNLLSTYLVARDKRFSSSSGSPWMKDCLGAILVVIPFQDIKEKTIRFKAPYIAGSVNGQSTSFSAVAGSNAFHGYIFNDADASLASAPCAVNEGNGTYSFLFNNENVIAPYADDSKMYVTIVVNTAGTAVTDDELAQVVITIDEPIVD